MSLNFETLVPGLLVSLKTTLKGNVSYNVRDLQPEMVAGQVGSVAQWETTRAIADVAEYEAAKKARSRARSIIGGVCVSSAFGLLCPDSKGAELRAAIADAQKIASEFNNASRLTKIGVFVITGKVASDDEQAIRAINSEMADLIEQMREGAANLDPAVIREAANKARDVSMMLSPATQERVGAAIELARKEARRIVKAGETAAKTVDASVIAALTHSRTAFLDMDTVQGAIAAPVVDANALDFAPETVAPAEFTEWAGVQDAKAYDAPAAPMIELDAPLPIAAPVAPAVETDNLSEAAFGDLFADDDKDDGADS